MTIKLMIKERVQDAKMNRFPYGTDYYQKKNIVEYLYKQVVGLQEVVIGLDFMMKAVVGSDSIQAGRDFRFHYDQINDAENFRRMKGYNSVLHSRARFHYEMLLMLQNINEDVNGSIITPPEDLIRELSNYASQLRNLLKIQFDMSDREVDEVAAFQTLGQMDEFKSDSPEDAL